MQYIMVTKTNILDTVIPLLNVVKYILNIITVHFYYYLINIIFNFFVFFIMI